MTAQNLPCIKVEDCDPDSINDWDAAIDSNSNCMEQLNFASSKFNFTKDLIECTKGGNKNDIEENSDTSDYVKDEETLDCFTNFNCQICGHTSSVCYLNVYICQSCKVFFLKSANESQPFYCKLSKQCELTPSNHGNCQFCRYQKCLQLGLYVQDSLKEDEKDDAQILCVVCGDIANGVHFGAITCEGCKKFFRRGLIEHEGYICKVKQDCDINPQTRNSCRLCRYNKCLTAGMSREAIQMGRPSKSKNNKVSFNRARPSTLKTSTKEVTTKLKKGKIKENAGGNCVNNWNKENSLIRRGRRKYNSQVRSDQSLEPDTVSSTTEQTSISDYGNMENSHSPYSSRLSPISRLTDFKANEFTRCKDVDKQQDFATRKRRPNRLHNFTDAGMNSQHSWMEGECLDNNRFAPCSEEREESKNLSKTAKRHYRHSNDLEHVEEGKAYSDAHLKSKYASTSQHLNSFTYPHFHPQIHPTDSKVNSISSYNTNHKVLPRDFESTTTYLPKSFSSNRKIDNLNNCTNEINEDSIKSVASIRNYTNSEDTQKNMFEPAYANFKKEKSTDCDAA